MDLNKDKFTAEEISELEEECNKSKSSLKFYSVMLFIDFVICMLNLIPGFEFSTLVIVILGIGIGFNVLGVLVFDYSYRKLIKILNEIKNDKDNNLRSNKND